MSEYKIRIAKALERIAEHLAAKDPVPSGTPDPEQRYEPTEKDFTLWNYLKKHGGTSLKGRKPEELVAIRDSCDRFLMTTPLSSMWMEDGRGSLAMKPASDIDLAVSLPGEQVAVAIIDLLKTMWMDMTPVQKALWNDWLIEDQQAWRKFGA